MNCLDTVQAQMKNTDPDYRQEDTACTTVTHLCNKLIFNKLRIDENQLKCFSKM